MIHRKLADSLLLLTSALSAAILSCSSVSNLPNPFATATATATATSTPTITPSPVPSPTATATLLPTGTALRDAPGGVSRFFDYDGGYIIDVPPDWAAVLLKPEDLQAAISQYVDANPSIANAIQNNQDTLSKAFRMVAFDKVPDHYADGYVANFSVAMFQDRAVISMPLDFVLQITVDQVKKQMPGAKIKLLPTKANMQAVLIGSAEAEASIKLPNGSRISMYEKQYYFLTKKAFVVVALYAPKSKASLVTPLFDKVFNGIKLLQP